MSVTVVYQRKERVNMKKKIMVSLLSLSMVMGMLAGCAQGGSTSAAPAASEPAAAQEEAPAEESKEEEAAPAEETAESGDDVTITFMASQDWIQDAEMELGEKFTEQTGIKVDYQIVPSDQYESLLMTKINAGECTDIFGGQSSQFSIVTQFDVEKNAVDLSGESWAGNVDPAAAVELSAGGKLYGQPIQDVSACWAVASIFQCLMNSDLRYRQTMLNSAMYARRSKQPVSSRSMNPFLTDGIMYAGQRQPLPQHRQMLHIPKSSITTKPPSKETRNSRQCLPS